MIANAAAPCLLQRTLSPIVSLWSFFSNGASTLLANPSAPITSATAAASFALLHTTKNRTWCREGWGGVEKQCSAVAVSTQAMWGGSALTPHDTHVEASHRCPEAVANGKALNSAHAPKPYGTRAVVGG